MSIGINLPIGKKEKGKTKKDSHCSKEQQLPISCPQIRKTGIFGYHFQKEDIKKT